MVTPSGLCAGSADDETARRAGYDDTDRFLADARVLGHPPRPLPYVTPEERENAVRRRYADDPERAEEVLRASRERYGARRLEQFRRVQILIPCFRVPGGNSPAEYRKASGLFVRYARGLGYGDPRHFLHVLLKKAGELDGRRLTVGRTGRVRCEDGSSFTKVVLTGGPALYFAPGDLHGTLKKGASLLLRDSAPVPSPAPGRARAMQAAGASRGVLNSRPRVTSISAGRPLSGPAGSGGTQAEKVSDSEKPKPGKRGWFRRLLERLERVVEPWHRFKHEVLSRREWGADLPNGVSRHDPRIFTVHHTVGRLTTSLPATKAELRGIQDFHQGSRRGWDDIAYHFLIDGKGVVALGRPLGRLGSHVLGHNSGNVGIALMGDFNKSRPTPQQVAALVHLVAYVMRKEDLPLPRRSSALLRGHREWRGGGDYDCPGRNLFRLIPWIEREVVEDVREHRRRRGS